MLLEPTTRDRLGQCCCGDDVPFRKYIFVWFFRELQYFICLTTFVLLFSFLRCVVRSGVSRVLVWVGWNQPFSFDRAVLRKCSKRGEKWWLVRGKVEYFSCKQRLFACARMPLIWSVAFLCILTRRKLMQHKWLSEKPKYTHSQSASEWSVGMRGIMSDAKPPLGVNCQLPHRIWKVHKPLQPSNASPDWNVFNRLNGREEFWMFCKIVCGNTSSWPDSVQ